tara:strand:+ start:544 stop:1083 length:540 start_codon:yes stop_codon:yes gene_type:complete
MKKININKNYGTLFFITGLSGSGKSSISKKIAKKIERIYGPTFLYSGERVRNIFKFYGYSRKERIELGKKNIQFINYILKQKINVVYDAIALLKVLRKIKRKTINNYVEIFIKTNVKEIIKFNKKKKIYKKYTKNVVGMHIKPEFPNNPDIIIVNDFNKNIDKLANELFRKIKERVVIK